MTLLRLPAAASAWIRAVWPFGALVVALLACSPPPTPTLSCTGDNQCNNGQVCKLGRCVGAGDFVCEKVADCDLARTAGSWTPTATGLCRQSACVDGLCAMAPRAAGTACDDADGLPCSLGACDDAGTCKTAAAVADGSCLIDDGAGAACIGDGAAKPGAPCLRCAPGQDARAWSALAQGSPCQPGAASACHLYACSAAGACEDKGVKGDACEIAGTCHSAGEAAVGSDGCRVCDPATSASAWTELAETKACAVDGKACRLGACKAGSCVATAIDKGSCYIDGACVADGALDPSAACRGCAAAVQQDAWTPLAVDTTPCEDDGIGCTRERCDGKGGCQHEIDDAACKDKDGVCVRGACDVGDTKGCVTAPKDVTATCDGADGVACTVEHCDGKGACEAVGAPTKAACEDAIACTLDSCDPKNGLPKSGCVHKPVDAACDDGNVCTADACDVGAGCAHLANAADCTADALPCTVEQCQDKACKLSIAAESCVIAGSCVPAGATQGGGCQSCKPTASQSAWTLAAVGAPCPDDGASCTADTCGAEGSCGHVAKAGACDDGVACTVDSCAPSHAWADTAGGAAGSGCAFIDDCAYGHVCDKTAKVCLTPKPVVLVTESAADPAPTNPVALRHVLDAKTGRTRLWVVYQSQAAAVAKDGKWAIAQGSQLRAVVLDPAMAATPGGAKPVPKVVTFANHVNGEGVVAAFPVVAADPESSTQGWLGWLEAGPGSGCLDGSGHGGVMRLARLDDGAIEGQGWTGVAGTACSIEGADKPLFVTPALAVLAGADIDPAKRGVIWARPMAVDLNSAGTKQITAYGPLSSPTYSGGGTALGNFSAVRPVVIDAGAEDANKARFWVLALGEKAKSGATQRELWAMPLDSKGVEDTPTKWLDSTVTGAGATVLGGVDAVCSLDAAWDADAGEAVVVVVTRQGGSDRVWLVRGKVGGAWVVTDVASATSKGDCRKGIASARVALGKGMAHVATYIAVLPSVPTSGTSAGYIVSGGVSKPQLNWPSWELATTDSAAGAGPTNALGSRGVAAAVMNPGGTMTAIFEAVQADKRVIVLETFKP